MSAYTQPMNTKMKEGFAEAGINEPLSCIVMDTKGTEYVFVNEKHSVVTLPELDLGSGKFEECHVIIFATAKNPICWEYKCDRYGCRWRPVYCE